MHFNIVERYANLRLAPAARHSSTFHIARFPHTSVINLGIAGPVEFDLHLPAVAAHVKVAVETVQPGGESASMVSTAGSKALDWRVYVLRLCRYRIEIEHHDI